MIFDAVYNRHSFFFVLLSRDEPLTPLACYLYNATSPL
jgi:hypothetical protein